jgi:hypothetical protein
MFCQWPGAEKMFVVAAQKKVLSNLCGNEVPVYKKCIPRWLHEEAEKPYPETVKTPVEISAIHESCWK